MISFIQLTQFLNPKFGQPVSSDLKHVSWTTPDGTLLVGFSGSWSLNTNGSGTYVGTDYESLLQHLNLSNGLNSNGQKNAFETSGTSPTSARLESELPFLSNKGQSALESLKRFSSVFPLLPNQKGGTGTYRVPSWKDDAFTTQEQVVAHWTKFPDDNHGVPASENHWVLDVDPRHGGDTTLAELEAKHGRLPETFIVHTPSGGQHFYFSAPNAQRNAVSFAPGLDVRTRTDKDTTGNYAVGYVVGVGSAIDGNSYLVTKDRPLAPAPTWLLDLINTHGATSKFERPNDLAEAVLDGTRNVTLFKTACSLRSRGLNEDAIYAALYAVNQEVCVPPLDEKELQSVVKSTMRYPAGTDWRILLRNHTPSDPTPSAPENETDNPKTEIPIQLTEQGNGLLFVEQHGRDIRHAGARGKAEAWLAWDGIRWTPEAEKLVVEKMKLTNQTIWDYAQTLYNAAKTEEEIKKATPFWTWAKQSQSYRVITNSIRLSVSDARVSVSWNMFDNNHFLLNLKNGTLDLKTHEFNPHDRNDYITKFCSALYDPEAKCPEFLKFIERIIPDKEIRGFIQRWFGYCLTGDISEQSVLLMYGVGKNGKSELLSVFRKLLGNDYAAAGGFNMFALRKTGTQIEPRNDIARLRGIRLLCMSENSEGVTLDESMLKQVTGGDAMSVRLLYHEFFDMVPEFKPTFATNHRPEIVGQDIAIWRRVCLVPFDVVIPEEERELDIHMRLLHEESSGILNWALQGLREQQMTGLNPPEAIRAATQMYKEEQDSLGLYLEEYYEFVKPGGLNPSSEGATEMYEHYVDYIKRVGGRIRSQTAFGVYLKSKRLESTRDNKGRKAWYGIKKRGGR